DRLFAGSDRADQEQARCLRDDGRGDVLEGLTVVDDEHPSADLGVRRRNVPLGPPGLADAVDPAARRQIGAVRLPQAVAGALDLGVESVGRGHSDDPYLVVRPPGRSRGVSSGFASVLLNPSRSPSCGTAAASSSSPRAAARSIAALRLVTPNLR